MVAPQVLLLDDGELDDVRSLLGELGVAFASLGGSGQPSRAEGPAPLLVATARRALSTPVIKPTAEEPVRVAILSEDSSTLRTRLRALGFGYLVRRPVHPEVLRLFLLRLLYRGDERRASERLPIGSTVSYRAGLWPYEALLLEISATGCRLLTPRNHAVDSTIAVRLPKQLMQGAALSLAARVTRCEPGGSGEPHQGFVTALCFAPLAPESEDRLRELLQSKAPGPETLSAREAKPMKAGPRPGGSPVLANASRPAHFRRSARRAYRSRVAAMHPRDRAMHVVVGRDLSTGGMRIEPHAGLRCGDRITLALFGRPGERIIVKAEVARDDGDAGLALRFEEPGTETRRRLEQIVAGLPQLEQVSEAGTRATVVAELEALGRRRLARRPRVRARV
jgi:hypothetical protein